MEWLWVFIALGALLPSHCKLLQLQFTDFETHNCGAVQATEIGGFLLRTIQNVEDGDISDPRSLDLCRTFALGPAAEIPNIQNLPYNFSLQMSGRGGFFGLPSRRKRLTSGFRGDMGFAYNVLDKDTYEFVYFPLATNTRLQKRQSALVCAAVGVVVNGTAVIKSEFDCPQQLMEHDEHNLRVQVKPDNGNGSVVDVRVFDLRGILLLNFSQPGALDARARIGVIGLNHKSTDISFKDIDITIGALDPCKIDKGGCDQICNSGGGSISCSCEKGYTLSANGKTCTAISPSKDPVITDMQPTHGPVAGKTVLTLLGENLEMGEYKLLSVADRRCNILYSNETFINATTPAFNDTTAFLQDPMPPASLKLGKPFHVKLTVGQFSLVSPQTFEYLGNPRIDSFMPRDTVLEGGVTVTVTGTNLVAVVTHTMIVTMIHQKSINGQFVEIDRTQFSSICTDVSENQMKCRTPELILPANFRSLDDTFSGFRKKRDDDQTIISSHVVDEERLQFYVSFQSDGVLSFEDETERNVITVYANPSFYQFDPLVQSYNPNSETPYVKVKGRHLGIGARVTDYRVMIGLQECTDLVLTDNLLQCLPPGREPQVDSSSRLSIEGRPILKVTLGKDHYIGHLDYTGVRRTPRPNGATSVLPSMTMCLFMVVVMLIGMA